MSGVRMIPIGYEGLRNAHFLPTEPGREGTSNRTFDLTQQIHIFSQALGNFASQNMSFLGYTRTATFVLKLFAVLKRLDP